MVDEYKADGDEYQHTFVVGSGKSIPEEASQEEINLINERIDGDEIMLADLSNGLGDLSEDLSGLGDDLSGLTNDYNDYKIATNAAIDEIRQQGLQANIKIVSEVPANPARDTLYLIKGDTMII